VAVVSAAASAVEQATSRSVPPFDPSSQRFDQSTFGGRFSRMLLACDPKLLLYSAEQVHQAKKTVDEHLHRRHRASSSPSTSRGVDRALWEARRVVEGAIHPDTGEVIPRPFRMSGYVPYNGPICVAMVASPSTSALLFWSWVNQSQNALVNYYNRNASSPMTNRTLAASYGAAVGSALAVALGLATAIRRRCGPARAKELLRWVAFPSAVVASSLNCFIVRSPEIKTGIPLTDEHGADVLPGTTSQAAAARGVYSTTASRCLLQAPVYLVPPLLLQLPAVKRHLESYPARAVPVTTFFLLVCFGIGLPASVAVFPQIASIPAEDCEPPYRHLRNARGEPHRVFYYNKGL
jgi:tricarboxylate carrier